jgi:cytoskeletal protein CcmA (bactofilin family)
VSENIGQIVIQKGTILQGDVRNCRQIDVAGEVRGDIAADHVVVHEGGRIDGTVRSATLTVHGHLIGEATVRGLLSIASTGSVVGQIRYGQLGIEPGGNLEADVRNIPPRLAGDHTIEVKRGGIGAITVEDLEAVDPDDPAEDLQFTVFNPTRGYVARSVDPGVPISSFTQADINAGAIVFVHDGSRSARASFDVVCGDAKGGTSGQPQTVRVDVEG